MGDIELLKEDYLANFYDGDMEGAQEAWDNAEFILNEKSGFLRND